MVSRFIYFLHLLLTQVWSVVILQLRMQGCWLLKGIQIFVKNAHSTFYKAFYFLCCCVYISLSLSCLSLPFFDFQEEEPCLLNIDFWIAICEPTFQLVIDCALNRHHISSVAISVESLYDSSYSVIFMQLMLFWALFFSSYLSSVVLALLRPMFSSLLPSSFSLIVGGYFDACVEYANL